MAMRINECVLWAENSDHFWRGGWQLYASFSQSFFHQFWKSQCSYGSKYPEFSNTPPTFALWMSLRVVMAIFPRNDIFLGHPVLKWIYCVHPCGFSRLNQLEKLEAAKSAYLCISLVNFPFLSLPFLTFLTFPYLFLPFHIFPNHFLHLRTD